MDGCCCEGVEVESTSKAGFTGAADNLGGCCSDGLEVASTSNAGFDDEAAPLSPGPDLVCKISNEAFGADGAAAEEAAG